MKNKKEEKKEEEQKSLFDDGPVSEKKEELKEKLVKAQPPKRKKESKKWVLIVLIIIILLAISAFLGYQYYQKNQSFKSEIQTTTTTTSTISTSTTTTTKASDDRYVYVKEAEGLNLRSEASVSGELIAIMPYGAKLKVIEESGDWYKVEYEEKTGWCSKIYTQETTIETEWKTYEGSGFNPEDPKFSINYPIDWALDGYKVSKTEDGKKYSIALGEGGHGMPLDDTITSASENVVYNGINAKKVTIKKSGVVFFIMVSFDWPESEGTTQVEFNIPEGYDSKYLATFESMITTFKFL